ncbi:MAG TPA: PAS domain S-box protein, partial [Pseudomonadales bacterium]|nr:PAS domain S-box protein [Pseudomonadales bacterium]
EITHRLLMPDGRVKWVNECCDTYYDDQGQPIKSIGTVQDITAHQKKLESSLIDSEYRLKAIFNTVLDGIIVINENGIIEMMNTATSKIFGYAQGELTGQPVNLLMSEADAASHDKYVNGFRSDGASKRIGKERSLMGRRKDGTLFPVEITVSEMILHDKRTFIGVCRDITERKKSEELTRQAQRMAEAASLAKSQFLATMTHELRTPMNSVLGMMQLVLMEDISDRQRQCLQAGQKAGNHLLEIINNILDYTKAEVGKLELKSADFSLASIIETLKILFSAQAHQKGIEFNINQSPDVPDLLHGDPLRIKQILINLIQNAIKFTEKGSVTVSIRSQRADDGYKLRFDIQDTGIGIAKQEQEKLFQVFQQVDNSITRHYGGTGLGLVISKQLVELMQGEIGVCSDIGIGSLFWFTVSVSSSQKNVRPLEDADGFDSRLQRLRSLKLLLVEPNQVMQKRISRIIMGRGMSVLCCNDYAEADTIINSQPLDAALISLDAVADEVTKLKELVEHCNVRALPVIGIDSPDTASHLHQQLGISNCLSQPLNNTDLMASLSRLVS